MPISNSWAPKIMSAIAAPTPDFSISVPTDGTQDITDADNAPPASLAGLFLILSTTPADGIVRINGNLIEDGGNYGIGCFPGADCDTAIRDLRTPSLWTLDIEAEGGVAATLTGTYYVLGGA